MRLLDVKPKDIYCYFEIALDDLYKIKTALENAEIQLDLSVESNKEVDAYIREVFYKEILETIKVVTHGTKS